MEARHGRVDAGAGAAVDDDRRLAVGIAVFGDVDLVQGRDLQAVRGVGLDRREEAAERQGLRRRCLRCRCR